MQLSKDKFASNERPESIKNSPNPDKRGRKKTVLPESKLAHRVALEVDLNENTKDIKIERKKHGPSLIMARWSNIKTKAVRPDEDDSSCSMVEENLEDSDTSKIHRKIAAKPGVNSSHSKSMSQNLAKEFKNHKKITSLDELYIQDNYMKLNSRNPYGGQHFDFKKEGFIIEVNEARFLPDTVNFVKVEGMVYEIGGKMITDTVSNILRLEGDINQISLDFILKIKDLQTQNYDDLYLLLIWETFQDIFGDNDVEFLPIIFGFSILKLFQPEGLKSLDNCVHIFNLEMEASRGSISNWNISTRLS